MSADKPLTNHILKTLDRAGDTLLQGFLSEALGYRGAALFIVIAVGLIPFGSLVNALWLGAMLLVVGSPAEAGMPASTYYAMSAGILALGLVGVWLDIKKMAKRPVAKREPIPN